MRDKLLCARSPALGLALSVLASTGCGSSATSATDGSIPDAAALPRDLGGDGQALDAFDPTPCRSGCVVLVPTRDGVKLWTKVFLPPALPEGGLPALLWRSPYRTSTGGGGEYEANLAKEGAFHNGRGYAYVFQDVRGRGDSGGSWEPLRHEIADGQDATHWIVKQPWSNGRVGTLGGSYDGFTALAAAVDNPDVRFVISDDGTTDERSERIGGTYSTHTLGWLKVVQQGEWLTDAEKAELTNRLDPLSFDVEVLGHSQAYWREALAQDSTTLWPADGSLEPNYAKLCVPALHVYSETSGWNDPIDIWDGMRQRGCEQQRAHQALFVTPDPHTHHLNHLLAQDTPIARQMLDAIDFYLAGRPVKGFPLPLVQYGNHGQTSLASADSWPPKGTSVTLFLQAPGTAVDGALLPAPGSNAASVLPVDPATMDPCASSYPWLTYVSTPLSKPLWVAGRPQLEVAVTVTTPDADLFVELWDYDPSRTAEPYIAAGEGAARLRFTQGPTPKAVTPGAALRLSIPLTNVSHRFEVGTRLSLFIGGGSCGHLENPQTGEPVLSQTRRQAGTLTVLHDGAPPSRLVLPSIP